MLKRNLLIITTLSCLFTATLLPAQEAVKKEVKEEKPAKKYPMDGIIKTERTPYIGVNLSQWERRRERPEGTPEGVGIRLRSVSADGPAAQAGLKAGDVLMEMDGQTIVNQDQLSTLIRLRKEGQTSKMSVYRPESRETIKVSPVIGSREHDVINWPLVRQLLAAAARDNSPEAKAFHEDLQATIDQYNRGRMQAWRDRQADNEKKTETALASPFPYLKSGDSNLKALAAAKDGATVLAGGRKRAVTIWDTKSRKSKTVKLPGLLQSVALSPDGKSMAVASEGGLVAIYPLNVDEPTGKTLREKGRTVRALSYFPDGKRLIIAGIDKKIQIWDIAAGKVLAENKIKSVPRCLAVSPDAKTIACGVSTREVLLLNAADLITTKSLHGHKFAVKAVDFSPDGTQILSGSDDMTLRLWKTSGEFIRSLSGHFSLVTGVAFLEDGKRAVSTSMDGSLRTWDLATGKELRKFQLTNDGLSCMAIGGGANVVAAGRNGLIYTPKMGMLK